MNQNSFYAVILFSCIIAIQGASINYNQEIDPHAKNTSAVLKYLLKLFEHEEKLRFKDTIRYIELTEYSYQEKLDDQIFKVSPNLTSVSKQTKDIISNIGSKNDTKHIECRKAFIEQLEPSKNKAIYAFGVCVKNFSVKISEVFNGTIKNVTMIGGSIDVMESIYDKCSNGSSVNGLIAACIGEKTNSLHVRNTQILDEQESKLVELGDGARIAIKGAYNCFATPLSKFYLDALNYIKFTYKCVEGSA